MKIRQTRTLFVDFQCKNVFLKAKEKSRRVAVAFLVSEKWTLLVSEKSPNAFVIVADELAFIYRQARETVEWLVSEPMMAYYLQTFVDLMWPNGKLADASPRRTSDVCACSKLPVVLQSRDRQSVGFHRSFVRCQEKTQTKLEAEVRLLQNIPEALNSLVGHENARRGTLKVFHAFQNKRLNKHLFYVRR